MPNLPRRRLAYLVLAAGVIAAGLASRRWVDILPDRIGPGTGDALWALLVMLLGGMLRPRWTTGTLALAVLAVSFAVEFAQLIRWPWLVALRGTTPGHLALGSTFHAPDLLAYAVGVVVGAALEALLRRGDRTSRLAFVHDTGAGTGR